MPGHAPKSRTSRTSLFCRIHLVASKQNTSRFIPSQIHFSPRRHSSNSIASKGHYATDDKSLSTSSRRCLQVIPTTTLVRSLVVLSATALPARLLTALIRITKTNVGIIEAFLPLRLAFKRTLYDNFCIGSHRDEIRARIWDLQHTGFTGIVLANAREAQSTDQSTIGSVFDDRQCEEWVQNNLQSIQQAEPGDYIGLRSTGAGAAASKLLSDFTNLCNTASLDEATKTHAEELEYYTAQVERIYSVAQTRQIRVLVDAECSVYQKAIDHVILQIMPKFNTSHRAIVS